jgi:hypothetical protein
MIGIVACRGDGGGQVRARPGAAEGDPVPGGVQRVRQGAERGRAEGVGQPRQPRGGVVGVGQDDPVRQGDRLAPLRDLGQAIGHVIRVADRGVTGHRHRRPATGRVVGVVDRALGGRLLREPIQAVEGPGDRARRRVHELGDAVTGVRRGRHGDWVLILVFAPMQQQNASTCSKEESTHQ